MELSKNGAEEFKKLGVEVVAVFREEREGLAGLEKVKAMTQTSFTLGLDTPPKATAAYSNGRKEYANYVVDKDGIIRGVIDGSVKNRGKSSKFLEIVKSLTSNSASVAAATPANDKAAVTQTIEGFADGIYQGKAEMIKQFVHPDAKVSALGVLSKGKVKALSMSDFLTSASTLSAQAKIPANAPKKVEVFNVSGELASAKLTSAWGTDMIHLVNHDGEWKIIQILRDGKAMELK